MQAILAGDWSFYMFGLRTPGYPLLLAGFRSLFQISSSQVLVWLVFQIALTSTGVILAMWVIHHLTQERRVALIGGLVLALDPMMLGAEVPLLSEALFITTFNALLFFILRWFSNNRWYTLLAAIAMLQIAVATRASSQYFIVILAIGILLFDWRRWPYILIIALGFCLPVGLWTARNIHYNGISAYSTAAVYNLLFYKSVSTESMVTGKSPDELAWEYAREVETRLGDPNNLDTEHFPVGNYDYLYVSDPERYEVMSTLGKEKLRQFHIWHLAKLPWHVFKNFLENVTFATIIPVPYAIQFSATLISVGLFALGIWRWLKIKHQLWQHAFVVLTVGYFVLGTAFFLALPASRYMAHLGAFWGMLVALGICELIDKSCLIRNIARNRKHRT